MTKAAPTKLLFLISVFTNNPNDWIDVFSSPLPRISGYPKRDKTIKLAINKLLETKRLEYKKEKEKILIRPTPQAFKELSHFFPFYRTFSQKWDGKYRLLFYDISEKERKRRDSLRRILQLNRLGRLQNSLWVSVYPVEELLLKLQKENLNQHLKIIEAKFPNQEREFAQIVWDLKSLNEKYKELYRIIEKVIQKPKGKRRMIEIFRKSFLVYGKILEKDPGLPLLLLPKDWYGLKVRGSLKKLQRII